MGIRSNSNKLKKQKAFFLDRDGTVIKHFELMRSSSQLKLLPRASQAIKTMNDRGFLVFLVSNQPVIARGLATPEEVEVIHDNLKEKLRQSGARIDAVYFCPHHPNADVKKYRIKCRCRKPSPGMILKAVKEFNIDPKKSFMVGDAMIDIVAGKRAGLKTVLVKTGPGHALDENFKHIKPNFTVRDIGDAAALV